MLLLLLLFVFVGDFSFSDVKVLCEDVCVLMIVYVRGDVDFFIECMYFSFKWLVGGDEVFQVIICDVLKMQYSIGVVVISEDVGVLIWIYVVGEEEVCFVLC